jgi:hypothetical protein
MYIEVLWALFYVTAGPLSGVLWQQNYQTVVLDVATYMVHDL